MRRYLNLFILFFGYISFSYSAVMVDYKELANECLQLCSEIKQLAGIEYNIFCTDQLEQISTQTCNAGIFINSKEYERAKSRLEEVDGRFDDLDNYNCKTKETIHQM